MNARWVEWNRLLKVKLIDALTRRLVGDIATKKASDTEPRILADDLNTYEFRTPKVDAKLILLLHSSSWSSLTLFCDRIHAVR